MAEFAVKNLQVSIKSKLILRGVDLIIKPGEIHAVMGPNGSGKSTLAYTLAGHPGYTVTKGSAVTLNDQDLLSMTPDERAKAGLFLAFQYPIEVSGVSVQNFLRAMWEARFGSLKAAGSPFKSVLEFRGYLKTKAEELQMPAALLERNLNEGFSGGERKRLEILQLAIFKPAYAILDETDSGLDIDALKIVAQGASQAAQDNQAGLLVITHYRRLLEHLKPDFVHIMIDGKIQESGGPELADQLEKTGYHQYGEEFIEEKGEET